MNCVTSTERFRPLRAMLATRPAQAVVHGPVGPWPDLVACALRATALAALLLAGGAAGARAQDSGHDAHHPAMAGDAGAPPTPGSPPDAAASRPGMAMPPAHGPSGTMGSGMMPGMCGMMMGNAGKGMMATGDSAAPAMEGPTDPVTGAFDAINRRMHRDMAVDASTGADRAFAGAMIAHHQGAIDMAKVILAFGSDPKMRALAEQVVKAQEGEIAIMRHWLAEQPQP